MPPEKGGHGAGPWIVLGIGAAAVATGVALLIAGESDISASKNECPNYECANSGDKADATNKQTSGYQLANTGAVVGIAGIALAATGVIWLSVHSPNSQGSARSAPLLQPVVSPTYAGLGFSAAF